MFRLFKRHVSEELSSYIDNQLSEAQRQAVEKHLEVCHSCAQELTELRGLSEKMKTWTAPELGPEFDNAVMQRIVRREVVERGQVAMDKKQWKFFVPVGALAGILVFALVAGQLYTKRGLQGGLRENVDSIGEQFSPSGRYTSRAKEVVDYTQRAGSQHYEPYYLASAHKVIDVRAGSVVLGDTSYSNANINLASTNIFNRLVTKTGSVREEAVGGAMRYIPEPTVAGGSIIVIQPVLPATGEGEKIIRTGTVTLEVEDGKEAYKKASEICRELGGYLGASNFYKDREDREAGTITMRIPKDKFLSALDKLGALGKVENISTNSQDVGQEYANLKSQLDATMVVYQKMLEALQKRQTTIPEAIRLESELTPILMRIESLKNQLEFLNNAVSFTTITVNFHEARVSMKVLKESGHFIRESLLISGVNGVKFLARAIPVAIVIIAWIVIAGLAVLAVKYLVIRLFKRR